MPIATIRRAFAVNPLTVPPSKRENSTLQASGIEQPTLRSYFVWRRSVMLFVLSAALLGAGLSTYREFFETSERMDVAETIAKHLPPGTSASPPTTIKANQLEEDEEESEAEPTKGASATTSESEPATDPDREPQTAFGRFTDIVQLVALYALPLAALAVVVLWTRLQLTFQITVAAFTFAFMIPLVIALCPWSWWGYVEPQYSPQAQPVQYFEQLAEGLLEGLTYLVTLLPTVLSLVPGVQKACIRVKMLLPQSMLPGWFLVVASPFYALFLLVVFVAINQFDTNPLFFVGMLLFLLAPLAYTVWSDVFTRPLCSEEDYRRIRGVQRIVRMTTAVAGAFLVTYLATRQLMGVRLLGLDYKTALIVPLDIVEFLLETLSRSMFVTVLGADLFVRMNLTAWKNTRDFMGSPEAEGYDRVMGELERIS